MKKYPLTLTRSPNLILMHHEIANTKQMTSLNKVRACLHRFFEDFDGLIVITHARYKFECNEIKPSRTFEG